MKNQCSSIKQFYNCKDINQFSYDCLTIFSICIFKFYDDDCIFKLNSNDHEMFHAGPRLENEL